MIETIVFSFFSGIVIFSSLAICFEKKLILSAFYLLAILLGIAGLYILLEADFLAVSQILVYVGGVLTLILFGVLLTKRTELGYLISKVNYRKRAATSVLLLGVILGYEVFLEKENFSNISIPQNNAQVLGYGIMGPYLLPFELAGVLILVILIGVLVLSSSVKSE